LRSKGADIAGAEPSAWSSRDGRKRHSLLDTGRGSTWWAPGAIGWWVGLLFAVGASCFALGSAPGYLQAVGNSADSLTFFVGSIFFTSASYLQYLEAVNARHLPAGEGVLERFRVLGYEPGNAGWWAASVQLLGTIFFNISTFDAMRASLSAPQVDKLVWRPDAYGSICFLVASTFAWIELGRPVWRARHLSWWIVAINMLGSIAFGVSAVAAFVVPTSGEPLNIMLVNLGTFVGAVCFFAGAVMLLPERTLEGS